MSKNIWVISDTHFSHANMLKFTDSDGNRIRNFDDVDQMNECMLENWNSVVRNGDIVYHLGDVFMGDREDFKKLWPKFNGSKRLIVGNHDDIKFLASGGFFKKTSMWRMMPELGLMLSHVPLHPSNLMRHVDKSKSYEDGCKSLLNVHGHIHQNKSPSGPYKNVSVEAIDYTPVNIDDLRVEL